MKNLSTFLQSPLSWNSSLRDMSCPNKNGLKTILGLRIRYVRKILRRSLDEIIF